jgi:hypothetical protein
MPVYVLNPFTTVSRADFTTIERGDFDNTIFEPKLYLSKRKVGMKNKVDGINITPPTL